MGMNPDTNEFEMLNRVDAVSDRMEELTAALVKAEGRLLRPNGEPVPSHWTVMQEGELVVIKGYTFKVAHIGEKHLLLEPHGPVIVGQTKE